MTSGECFENKWFYMKYIEKYLSVEILLTRDTCITKDWVTRTLMKNQSELPEGQTDSCTLVIPVELHFLQPYC
jgi:hypothetical protein